MADEYISPAVPLLPTPLVTSHQDLRRMMIHEFPSPSAVPNYPNLDENKVKSMAIDSLTSQQKEYLASQPRGKMENRLIMFVTLDPPTGASSRLMGAINSATSPAKVVSANASFSIFHCKKNTEPSLICHSQEFFKSSTGVVNIAPTSTPPNGLTTYRIGAVPYAGGTRPVSFSVIWHRLYDSNGADVMQGNYIHGFINTAGCWMMFRNYNWPKQSPKFPDAYPEFMEAYRLRKENKPEADEKLKELSYRSLKDGGLEVTWDNREKHEAWDANFSYYWLTRDLIGIEYFSVDSTHNDYNVDGALFYPIAYPTQKASVANRKNTAGKNAHSIDSIGTSKASVTFTDALFRNDNVLGFKPQESFGKGDIDKRTWADVVFYQG